MRVLFGLLGLAQFAALSTAQDITGFRQAGCLDIRSSVQPGPSEMYPCYEEARKAGRNYFYLSDNNNCQMGIYLILYKAQ